MENKERIQQLAAGAMAEKRKREPRRTIIRTVNEPKFRLGRNYRIEKRRTGSHEQKQMHIDWRNHTKVRAPRSEDPKLPAAEVLCASRIHENTFDYNSPRPGCSVFPGLL